MTSLLRIIIGISCGFSASELFRNGVTVAAVAAKIKALMTFTGAYTNATPAPEGAECANCRNEAKRHTDKDEPDGGNVATKTL